MVKIKYDIKNKNTLFNKFNDLVDNFEDIKNYYNNISKPSDFDKNTELSKVNDLFDKLDSNINLVEQSLKKYVYELENIQLDLLDNLSNVPVDSLPSFDGELLNTLYNKNN